MNERHLYKNDMPRKQESYRLNPHAFRIALAYANKTQKDVALHLGHHTTWVSQIKRGFFKCNLKDARKIANYLGADLKQLFDIDN